MQQNRVGLETGTGQSLYRRAKQLIPGGTQLLSKRPDMFLPDQWPATMIARASILRPPETRFRDIAAEVAC